MTDIASPIKTMLSSPDFDLVKQGLSLLAATDKESFGRFAECCGVTDDDELVVLETGDSIAKFISVTHRSSATILANARLGRFEGLTTLKLLDLEGFDNLSLLGPSSSLVSLVFRTYRENEHRVKDSMGGFEFLDQFPNLQNLVLDAVVNLVDVECESAYESLESLRLRTIFGDSLSNLSVFPSLNRLKITRCSTSFVSLSLPMSCEHLVSLSLQGCGWLTDLSGLQVCERLEYLTLHDLRDMPINELAVIRTLPRLTDLSLSGAPSVQVPDQVFDPSMRIERLSIGEGAILGGGLLEHLEAIQSLEEVEFQGGLYIDGVDDQKHLASLMRDIPRVRLEKLGWRSWLAFVEVLIALHGARTWDEARSRLLALSTSKYLNTAIQQLNLTVRPLSARYGNKELKEITKEIAEELHGNASLFFMAVTWQIQGVFPDSLDLRDMGVTDITPLRYSPGLKSIRLDKVPHEYGLAATDFADLEAVIIDSDADETGCDTVEAEDKNVAQEWLSRCRQLEV
jgi:hypothetical protein